MAQLSDAELAKRYGAQPVSDEAALAHTYGAEPFIGGTPLSATPVQPHWWDWVKALPGNLVSAFGHVIQLPSDAAQEFMHDPLNTTAALGKGLLGGVLKMGQLVTNLPHDVYHRIPAFTTTDPNEIDRTLGIEKDPAGQLAELISGGGLAAGGERLATQLVAKELSKLGEKIPLITENSGRVLKRVLPATRNAATRAGYWAGVNRLQGGRGGEGAALSLTSEIPYLGGYALKRIPLKMAEKEAQYTTAAGARNPMTRTPAEAKQLMELVGPDFPTSLGAVSGARSLKKAEGLSSWLPFSPYNAHMESGLYNTDQLAHQLIDALKGNSAIAHLGEDIHAGLNDAREAAKNEMNQAYAPIEKVADAYQYRLKDLPHFRNKVESYLTGEAGKVQKGLRSPLPDFTDTQKALLASYLKKPTPRFNPVSYRYETDYPTLAEARGLESDLKAKARDEGHKGNRDTQKAFNEMAAALRQDYAHNAEQQGLQDIVPALTKANQLAKTHYYDIWDKPDIQNLLQGKSSQFYHTLMKRQHRGLLNQLPQDLKHKIFLSHIAQRIQEGQKGERISPATLSTLYGKQGLKDADAKSHLLSAAMRQKFNRLLAMNELTKDVRVRQANVPTGKMLLPIFKYGPTGALGIGAMLHPWLALPFIGLSALGRGGSRYLTDPETIARYTGQSTQSLKRPNKFQLPWRGLGVAATQWPENNE